MRTHDLSMLKPLWWNFKEKFNIPKKSICDCYDDQENSYGPFRMLDVVFRLTK